MNREDWIFSWAFAYGEFLAAWHYATLGEAVMRGVSIFVLMAIGLRVWNAVKRKIA